MLIEMPPQPPAGIAPLRGDDFFSQQQRERPAKKRAEAGVDFGRQRERPSSNLGRDLGQKGGFKEKTSLPRGRERGLGRTAQRQARENFAAMNSPLAFGWGQLNQPESSLDREGIAAAVDTLGEVTEQLGGRSFSQEADLAGSRHETKAVLVEQIESFSAAALDTAANKLNPQRLKELAKLDLAGHELKPFKALSADLSANQLEKIKQEVKEAGKLISADNFDLNSIRQHFENNFDESEKKSLAGRLLYLAAVTALTAAALGTKDKRVKLVTTALLTAMVLSCCGGGTEAVPGATQTVEATAAPTDSPPPYVIGLDVTPSTEPGSPTFSPTETQPIGQPSEWAGAPTIEQIYLGRGGPIPEGVQSYRGFFEDVVENTEIYSEESVGSAWNGGTVDATRIHAFVKNPGGPYQWWYEDGRFQEYPTNILLDDEGYYYYDPSQELKPISGSEDAYIVYAGNVVVDGVETKFGEKPVLVRGEVELPDGRILPGEYFDFQTETWLTNPYVLQALLPQEFLSQFDGTEFGFEGVGLVYTADNGQQFEVPGIFTNDGSFEFDLAGETIKAARDQLDVWDVLEDNHLVIKGDNGIPAYQFNETAKVWEAVEQITMVDAFDNTVPGWIVEKSEVWDGVPTEISQISVRAEYYAEAGYAYQGLHGATLKQKQVVEYVAEDGTKVQNLWLTYIFKNEDGKVISITGRTHDLNFEARGRNMTPREFIDSFLVGQIMHTTIFWADSASTMTPEKLAEERVKYAEPGELCYLGVPQCGLDERGLRQKHPRTWFTDVYHGIYGDNLNLIDDIVFP